MAVGTKNVIESFRDVVQDLLVPELKAVKVSVESMREDIRDLRGEMKDLRGDMKDSIDALRVELKLREEKHEQTMRHLAEKLDFAIDIRERIASLEARMPRR